MREIDVEKLYELAGSEAATLEGELHDLAHRLLRDLKLKAFWSNYAVPAKQKLALFREIHPDATETFCQLFTLLSNEMLISRVPWLSAKYSEIVSRRTGIRSVVVKSARQLSPVEMEAVKNQVGPGHRLEFRVRPELIGGINIQWANGRRIDASLSGLLAEMKEELLV